jgi:hypothetical protein
MVEAGVTALEGAAQGRRCKQRPICLRRPIGAGLFDLDTSDFDNAAFRTLEAIEVAFDGFGLNAE